MHFLPPSLSHPLQMDGGTVFGWRRREKYVDAIALGGILPENHIKVSVYTQSQDEKVSLFESCENIETKRGGNPLQQISLHIFIL